jgi:hypothetical protein
MRPRLTKRAQELLLALYLARCALPARIIMNFTPSLNHLVF